ncbi:MAG TPA: transglutaminase-like domain-containing protein [Patescibacteria group bacterium]|nr:transglutaminase-like domain-containing protein [Patescibacteria group bacterium]
MKKPVSPQKYYSTQSSVTNPGRYAPLLNQLPNLVADLCKVIHGLIIHKNNTEDLYGFKLSRDRILESNTRYIEEILARIIELDDSPLAKTRSPKKRFVGTCRDFALLLCSFLRQKSVPARLRSGFATYFLPGYFWDHWVCEYWDGIKKQWILVDPEVGKEEIETYRITINPLDLTRDQFMPSGKAWNICRAGKMDANLFGINETLVQGFWFMRGSVFRDLAALNKIELLPWDYTKFMDKHFKDLSVLAKSELELIDKIATLTSREDDSSFAEILALYQSDPRLQVGKTVKSYTDFGPKEVVLI